MDESDSIISPAGTTEDLVADNALRPKRLKDYLGQASVHEQMEIFIEAARKRSEALDHVLIFGPPGLGKTTLAHTDPSRPMNAMSPAIEMNDAALIQSAAVAIPFKTGGMRAWAAGRNWS